MSIGASKPGFKPPPPSLKIPEVLDFHAEQNADYPFFRYAQDDVVHQISYAQLKLGIERAAAYALEVGRGSDAPVAVLAITGWCSRITVLALDSYSYFRLYHIPDDYVWSLPSGYQGEFQTSQSLTL